MHTFLLLLMGSANVQMKVVAAKCFLDIRRLNSRGRIDLSLDWR